MRVVCMNCDNEARILTCSCQHFIGHPEDIFEEPVQLNGFSKKITGIWCEACGTEVSFDFEVEEDELTEETWDKICKKYRRVIKYFTIEI